MYQYCQISLKSLHAHELCLDWLTQLMAHDHARVLSYKTPEYQRLHIDFFLPI